MFGRNISDADHAYMQSALDHATQGSHQGGIPAGAVLVIDNKVIGGGRNRRVQEGNPAGHAIIDCLRLCGVLDSYDNAAIYTTSSPCMMCAGAILHFRIPRVVIGDSYNFKGATAFLKENGVEVLEMNMPECIEMLETFLRERPGTWDNELPPHVAG